MTFPLLPEYGRRSLAEVFPAVLTALGVPGPAGELVVPPARAVAVLLIDGLGHEILHAHAADAPFLAGLPDLGPLTVGFPSSTVVSLASLGTGLPPGAHGMLGTSFRVGDGLLDALHWTVPGPRGADLRTQLPPEQLQPRSTVFERAEVAGIGVAVVSSRQFRNSGVTRANLRGGRFHGTSALGDLAAELITTLGRPGPRLAYGYHADLDAVGHGHGPGSLAWRMQLATVDRFVAMVAEALPPDAVLLVTGDHGMVGVDRKHDADTDADLRRDVVALGGDTRARFAYAAPGAAGEVLATWRAVLGEDAWVLSGAEAVAGGWFGPRVEHPERVGDVVAAARGSAAVIRSVGEPGIARLPGHHGSLSAAEQFVPLLIFQRSDQHDGVRRPGTLGHEQRVR